MAGCPLIAPTPTQAHPALCRLLAATLAYLAELEDAWPELAGLGEAAGLLRDDVGAALDDRRPLSHGTPMAILDALGELLGYRGSAG